MAASSKMGMNQYTDNSGPEKLRENSKVHIKLPRLAQKLCTTVYNKNAGEVLAAKHLQNRQAKLKR